MGIAEDVPAEIFRVILYLRIAVQTAPRVVEIYVSLLVEPREFGGAQLIYR